MPLYVQTFYPYSILSLFLRLLFKGFYRFPGFPSNPCFSRQNPCFLRQIPVLPRFLRPVPRVVCGEGGGGPALSGRSFQPLMWCYPGVQLNLPEQSPSPGPRPAPIPAGDWGSELQITSSFIRNCLCCNNIDIYSFAHL